MTAWPSRANCKTAESGKRRKPFPFSLSRPFPEAAPGPAPTDASPPKRGKPAAPFPRRTVLCGGGPEEKGKPPPFHHPPKEFIMTDMDWLMYANIAVWIGLGAYLAFLLRNQIALNRRLAQLETLRND